MVWYLRQDWKTHHLCAFSSAIKIDDVKSVKIIKWFAEESVRLLSSFSGITTFSQNIYVII